MQRNFIRFDDVMSSGNWFSIKIIYVSVFMLGTAISMNMKFTTGVRPFVNTIDLRLISFIVFLGLVFYLRHIIHKKLRIKTKRYYRSLLQNTMARVKSYDMDRKEYIPTIVEFGETTLSIRLTLPSSVDPQEVFKEVEYIERNLEARCMKKEVDYREVVLTFLHTEREVTTDFMYETHKNPVLGIDLNGEEFQWDILKMPHLGVFAKTGSGKSVYSKAIVKQLMDIAEDVKFVDFKNADFGQLKHKGYEVITENEEMMVFLNQFHDEMMERKAAISDGGFEDFRDAGMKPRFLVMDEFASAVQSFPGNKEGNASKAEFFKILGNIARLGRSMGYNLMIITQRPDKTYFGDGDFRSNITNNVVLKGGDRTIRTMVYGEGRGDLKGLDLGYAYVNTEDGDVETIKMPYYENKQFVEDMTNAIQGKDLTKSEALAEL